MWNTPISSQKGESRAGPVGKCASSAPICSVNTDSRERPPKAGAGEAAGTIQLRAGGAERGETQVRSSKEWGEEAGAGWCEGYDWLGAGPLLRGPPAPLLLTSVGSTMTC